MRWIRPRTFYILGALSTSGSAYYYYNNQKKDAFLKYIIHDREILSKDIILLHLQAASSDSLDIKNGEIQHVEVLNPFITVLRSYTPLSKSRMSIDLIVKKYNDGIMGRYLYNLPIASSVSLRGYFDSTPHSSNDKVVFIVGGTGVATALQFMNSYTDKQVRVIYYTKPGESLSSFVKGDIVEHARRPTMNDVKDINEKDTVFICGSDGFVGCIRKLLPNYNQNVHPISNTQ